MISLIYYAIQGSPHQYKDVNMYTYTTHQSRLLSLSSSCLADKNTSVMVILTLGGCCSVYSLRYRSIEKQLYYTQWYKTHLCQSQHQKKTAIMVVTFQNILNYLMEGLNIIYYANIIYYQSAINLPILVLADEIILYEIILYYTLCQYYILSVYLYLSWQMKIW